MNREAVYQALYNKFLNTGVFVTTGRRLKLWDDVTPAQKPAMFMLQRGDDYVRKEPVPAIVTLNVDLFIYTAAAQTDVPASAMNDLLDAVDAALQPPAYTSRQTLGGLVSHCWIEGHTLLDTGELDGQGLAVVPIKILATV